MSSAAAKVLENPVPKPVILEAAITMLSAAAFAAMLLGITLLTLTGNHPGGRDFISYFTAGHQLLHHANPYDATQILTAERSAGFPATSQSLIMRNAPWALPLVLPLGLLGLRDGALLWSLLLIACLGLSIHQLWLLFNRNKLILLACSFGPALICILAGQTAVIALLGLVLFLRFHTTCPFLAGASLWLCALKPHLFLPFAIALLLWIIATRTYSLLAGLLAPLLASSLLATAFNPAVWLQYLQMMRTANLEREFIPCLAIALRFAIHRQSIWLQYLPAVAACIWATRYFLKNRHHWNWLEHGALLMLVSILAAPYAWTMDQALLIPALLFAASRATRTQLEILALATAAIEFATLFAFGAHSPFYLWTAPFWLAWYLFATRKRAFQILSSPKNLQNPATHSFHTPNKNEIVGILTPLNRV